jgi:hypothetical protein
MRPRKLSAVQLAGGLSYLCLSVAAAAGYPGSTQPGAQQVAPGNIILLRVVPPRNAIVPGTGSAVTAPTAPPSMAFDAIRSVGSVLSDAQAASVTGTPAGIGGGSVPASLAQALNSQSATGGAAADRSGAARGGAAIGGAVETGLGALRGALNGLGGGAGH